MVVIMLTVTKDCKSCFAINLPRPYSNNFAKACKSDCKNTAQQVFSITPLIFLCPFVSFSLSNLVSKAQATNLENILHGPKIF